MKSKEVTAYIRSLAEEWQREACRELRKLIHEAAPKVVESIKQSVPFFEYSGQLCSMSAPGNFVQLVFVQGARLPQSKLFSDTGAAQTRSILIGQGQMMPAQEIIGLVRAAVKLNSDA